MKHVSLITRGAATEETVVFPQAALHHFISIAMFPPKLTSNSTRATSPLFCGVGEGTSRAMLTVLSDCAFCSRVDLYRMCQRLCACWNPRDGPASSSKIKDVCITDVGYTQTRDMRCPPCRKGNSARPAQCRQQLKSQGNVEVPKCQAPFFELTAKTSKGDDRAATCPFS